MVVMFLSLATCTSPRYDTCMVSLPESDLERMRFFAVKELIKALRGNQISADQLPQIAKEILKETKDATTPTRLTEALYAIGKKYDALIPVSNLYQSYLGEKLAEQSAQELTRLLANDNVDEAHKLVKSLYKSS